MDLIQAITSGDLGKTTVTLPIFDTETDKGIFEVREMTVEGRINVRRNSIRKLDEPDKDGQDQYIYDDNRYRAALVAEATYYPDGRRVFDGPDIVDRLLKLPGKFDPAFQALFTAAQDLSFATPSAEVTARKNSSKSRKPAT